MGVQFCEPPGKTQHDQHGARGLKHAGHTRALIDERERRLIHALRRTGNPTERRFILDSIISVRNEISQVRKGVQFCEPPGKTQHDP
jgi:hypothetical protein